MFLSIKSRVNKDPIKLKFDKQKDNDRKKILERLGDNLKSIIEVHFYLIFIYLLVNTQREIIDISKL